MKQDLEVQLALGRELTQKNQQSDSSDSEDDEEITPVAVKNENPWLGAKQSTDPLDEVFSGYKKFWEDHNENQKQVKKAKSDLKKAQRSVVEKEVEEDVDEADPANESDEDVDNAVESDEVSDSGDQTESDDENPSKFINDLFDEAEEKVNSKMELKLESLKPNLLEKERKKKTSSKKRSANVRGSNYLGFQKKAKLGDVDEALDDFEEDDRRRPTKLLLKEVKQRKVDNESFMRGSNDINPEFFLKVKSKHLITAIPKSQDLDEVDDEFEVNQLSKANKMSLAEAFENDDIIINDFEQDAEDDENKSSKADVVTLPGWGHWEGHGMKAKKHKFEKKSPQIKRKDRIIINKKPNEKLQKHLISSVPFPFKSVRDFEESMRLPVGRDFIPESAHLKLVLPSVVTKAGTVIEPMSEDVLVQNAPTKNKFIKRGKKGGRKGKKASSK